MKEFAPVYFNFTTKTVLNSKVLHRIDDWINGRSGWVI